ncbi:MAG TPA: hypothetical protein VM120_06965 [Bryobacteraceae bacterium]|nr:hypothetical protein [Bryobacteraceae bacterium]
MRQIVLFGLEEELAGLLCIALHNESIRIESEIERIGDVPADLVLSPFSADLVSLLNAVSAPVVVVTRHKQTDEYIDAMEAGAADYCVAPFQPKQLLATLKDRRNG